MSHPELPAEHHVEDWVRDYLCTQERSVDARSILSRVRKRLAAAAPPKARALPEPRPSRGRRWLWGLASAAAVFLALTLAVELGTTPASAETLVNAARARAEEAVDRCYQVQAERDPAVLERPRVLPFQRQGQLWTRGKQFVMRPVHPQVEWAWGRDDQGRVWITCKRPEKRQVGFRFEPSDVPASLLQACARRGMEVETLLQEVVVHFDLSREGPRATADGPVLIVRGVLKPEHRHDSLRAAYLEMDAHTKILRRVVLYDTRTTLRFTLARTAPPDDTRYRMETYLEPDALINSSHTEPMPRVLERLRDQLLRASSRNAETKTAPPG